MQKLHVGTPSNIMKNAAYSSGQSKPEEPNKFNLFRPTHGQHLLTSLFLFFNRQLIAHMV